MRYFLRFDYKSGMKVCAAIKGYPDTHLVKTMGMRQVSWLRYWMFKLLPLEMYIVVWGDWDNARR